MTAVTDYINEHDKQNNYPITMYVTDVYYTHIDSGVAGKRPLLHVVGRSARGHEYVTIDGFNPTFSSVVMNTNDRRMRS